MLSEGKPSGEELLFQSLRALMKAHLIWGPCSSLELSELCGLLHTTETRLAHVVTLLSKQGWVAYDAEANSVGLTAKGVHHFMAYPVHLPVELPLPKWQ